MRAEEARADAWGRASHPVAPGGAHGLGLASCCCGHLGACGPGHPFLRGCIFGPAGRHALPLAEEFPVVPLQFSQALDAHNPNTPEWREDIGLLVSRLLSKVCDPGTQACLSGALSGRVPHACPVKAALQFTQPQSPV